MESTQVSPPVEPIDDNPPEMIPITTMPELEPIDTGDAAPLTGDNTDYVALYVLLGLGSMGFISYQLIRRKKSI